MRVLVVGLERSGLASLELLKARALLPKFDARLDVLCLVEDETLRSESLGLIQQLRAAGRSVDYSFTPAKSDKQFKRALENNAAYTIKLERTPAGAVAAKIKNLRTREDKTLSPQEAVSFLASSIFSVE